MQISMTFLKKKPDQILEPFSQALESRLEPFYVFDDITFVENEKILYAHIVNLRATPIHGSNILKWASTLDLPIKLYSFSVTSTGSK